MDDNENKIKSLIHECEICHEEIPESAAVTGEGIDYAWHICSNCYQKLKDQSSA